MNRVRIEELSLNAWPALYQLLFDGWVLRLSEGYTKRANSVNPVYAGAISPTDKIAFCESVYRRHGLPPVFRLTSLADPDPLDRELEQRGYQWLDPTSVQYLDLAHVSARASVRLEDWSDRPAHWISVFHELKDGARKINRPHRAIIQRILTRKALMVLADERGRAVACGMCVLEHEHVGLFDCVTRRECRNRGFGQLLVSGMLEWARQHGARHAYLQVVKNNLAALRLYQKAGFEEIYHYWYRAPAQ